MRGYKIYIADAADDSVNVELLYGLGGIATHKAKTVREGLELVFDSILKAEETFHEKQKKLPKARRSKG